METLMVFMSNISEYMLDIPDAAAGRPARPLHLKSRVNYLQIRLITRIQESGHRAYLQHMFTHMTDRGFYLL